MTPSNFRNDGSAHEFTVLESGVLHGWGHVVWGFGVRPVINLNTADLTFTGTGTMQDPYVVS